MNEDNVSKDDAAVGRCWEGNAAGWTKLSRMGFDVYRDLINTPAFLEMLPTVAGLHGLDVGCGEGHNTRLVAQRGASMTGIDIAPTFIRHADEAEAQKPLGIRYQLASAEQLPFEAASFDFAMATMSLMDMPQPELALAEVFRVLKPGGFFQFSISHPCFNTPYRKLVRDAEGKELYVQIAGYFDRPDGAIEEWIFGASTPEAREGIPKFKTPRFHRTLSSWINLLIDSGFEIERLYEPYADEELARRRPEVRDTRLVSYFLHIRCRKREAARACRFTLLGMPRYSLGFDYGTESVRVLVVDIKDGRIAGQASSNYTHGVIDNALPTGGGKLPGDYALQHPQDWLDSLAIACKAAIKQSKIDVADVIGIGVDFTSCTMLPAKADGTPLCMLEAFGREPLAWPKLWKHHGAKAETIRINEVARDRKESWLGRYGGTIGLEWFFPKTFETLHHAPKVYEAADLFVEAGDWLVWQLTTGPYPRCDVSQLVRSTCQAGYKAMWNAKDGFPSRDYFKAVHPKLANVVTEKMTGELRSPGRQSGVLSTHSAHLLGLRPGIPISTAIIDAHSGVPGAGVASPSTMVMVLGTSSCHMLNSRIEQLAPGIAGVVEDGILPGYFGYETGQASVGDAFAWLVDTFKLSFDELAKDAAALPPGAGGVLAIDWLNGCRTPLMDADVSSAFVGLTLATKPAQLYRALIEATAFGVRWIVETLRDAGVPVRRFVASGGLPAKSPLLMQIYADVLGEKIAIAESDQSVALGAAILGCIAAGSEVTGYAQISQAIHAMARQREDLIYRPDLLSRRAYEKLYPMYRSLGECDGAAAKIMRQLRKLPKG